MTREQKLERWAEREITRNIDHIILDHTDGGLLAFGIYDIKPLKHCAQVWRDNELLITVSNRYVALCWCVAHRKNILNLMHEIQHLDQQRSYIRNDLVVMLLNQRQARTCEFDETLEIKIQNKQWYENMLDCQLEKCLSRAKYLQLRGFNNETARTRTA